MGMVIELVEDFLVWVKELVDEIVGKSLMVICVVKVLVGYVESGVFEVDFFLEESCV